MKIRYVLGISLLAGCAVNSGVLPMGQDSYMVSRQAATGFTGSGTLKADAFNEATAYCEKQGKRMQVTHTEEAQPPYLYGNFPKAEVMFMCLSPTDKDYGRPKMMADPKVSIKQETQVINSGSEDGYTQLKKLKELLDSGAITQSEYNQQKQRILSR